MQKVPEDKSLTFKTSDGEISICTYNFCKEIMRLKNQKTGCQNKLNETVLK